MNVVPILYIYIYTRRFCLSLLFLKSRYIDIAKKGFIYAKPHACISYHIKILSREMSALASCMRACRVLRKYIVISSASLIVAFMLAY